LVGAKVEQTYVDILKAVRAAVTIPVAVKLSPFFSNMANMAKRFDDAGANALVLFNRFYQPDIDLEELEVKPDILLSTPFAMRLPLTWVAILHGRIKADLAATSGILASDDALKMLMAGAKVAMLCSALFRHGIEHIRTIEQGMVQWMEEREYESVQQMIGSMSQIKCDDPSAFERAQYMRALASYKGE
jgi:dihydroorotate dehydrogenase (fumarate)